MRKLWEITALLLVIAIFLTGCPTDDPDEPDEIDEPIEVAFSGADAANGSQIVSTTALTLTFSDDIEELEAGDFTLTIPSPFTVSRGSLAKTGTGVYTLGITLDGTDAGDVQINVAVAKQGFTFSPDNRDVTVSFQNANSASINSDSDRETIAIGNTLTAELDLTSGTGDSVIQWVIDGVAGQSTSDFTLALEETHRGSLISVRAQRSSWEEDWVESPQVGPIVNGWMVTTVLNREDDDFVPWTDSYTLDVDSQDLLYTKVNLQDQGRHILKIDTTATRQNPLTRPKVDVFTDSNISSGGRWIAVGPNDAVYFARWDGDKNILRFPQPGGEGHQPDWHSNNNIPGAINALNPNYGYSASNTFEGNLAVDEEGNVYIATRHNSLVVKVTPEKVVSIVAALDPGQNGNDRLGGIAIGPDGFIYVAHGRDIGAIHKIDPDTGEVTDFVGGETTDWNNPLGFIRGFTFGRDGHFYAVDRMQGTESGPPSGDTLPATEPVIRRITVDGVVTTVAGIPGAANHGSMVDGLIKDAKFLNPWGIAAASDGTIYVMDNHRNNRPGAIRMIYYDTRTVP